MSDDERRDRLIEIVVDDSGLPPATPEVEQERRVAIFDLTEENRFGLPSTDDGPAPAGPYRLNLGIRDRQLIFEISGEDGGRVGEFHLSQTPFNQIVKDYFEICEAYFDAVRRLPAAQIEAFDEGRRSLHDQGSRVLLERLQGKVDTDLATARRLFTLICVLHFRG